MAQRGALLVGRGNQRIQSLVIPDSSKKRPRNVPTLAAMSLVSNEGLSLKGHSDAVNCIVASHQHIASGADDHTIRTWDQTTQKSTRAMRSIHGPVQALSLGTNQTNTCIIAAANTSILLYDIRVPEIVINRPCTTIEGAADEISALALHTDGLSLAAADDGGNVRIHDLRSGTCRGELKGCHTNICSTIAWRPGVPELVSGGLDSRCVVWDVNTLSAKRTWIAGPSALPTTDLNFDSMPKLLNPPFVHSLSHTADGAFMAIALGDGSLQLVDSVGNLLSHMERCHSAAASGVLFLDGVHENSAHFSNLGIPLLTMGDDLGLNLLHLFGSQASSRDNDDDDKQGEDFPMKRQRNLLSYRSTKMSFTLDNQARLSAKPNDMAVTPSGIVYVAETIERIEAFSII